MVLTRNQSRLIANKSRSRTSSVGSVHSVHNTSSPSRKPRAFSPVRPVILSSHSSSPIKQHSPLPERQRVQQQTLKINKDKGKSDKESKSEYLSKEATLRSSHSRHSSLASSHSFASSVSNLTHSRLSSLSSVASSLSSQKESSSSVASSARSFVVSSHPTSHTIKHSSRAPLSMTLSRRSSSTSQSSKHHSRSANSSSVESQQQQQQKQHHHRNKHHRSSNRGSSPRRSTSSLQNNKPALLGRGHRIQRNTTTLDEEYLRASLQGKNVHHANKRQGDNTRQGQQTILLPPPQQQRLSSSSLMKANNNNNNNKGKGSKVSMISNGKSDKGQSHYNEKSSMLSRNRSSSATRHRYPEREAAKRAINSLKETFHYIDTEPEEEEEEEEHNGRYNINTDDDDNVDKHGNQKGTKVQFHFRHHPEITEELRNGKTRYRYNSEGEMVTDDDDDDNEDNNNLHNSHKYSSNGLSSRSEHQQRQIQRRSTSPQPLRPSTRHNGRKSNNNSKTPRTSMREGRSSSSSSSLESLNKHKSNQYSTKNNTRGRSKENHTYVNTNTDYNHKRHREESIDSSISDDSLRDESTERMIREDALAAAEVSDSSSEDEVATPTDLARATKHAKESTLKNIRINYYLHDAMGEVDVHKARKHAIDRRYRHLFYEDEKHKMADCTEAVGTISGSSTNGPMSGINNSSNSNHCNPFAIPGSSGSGNSNGDMNKSGNAALGDVSPLHIDQRITFDSVGGLPGHIVALREMVLLPLLYPDLIAQMQLSPPRGVLFVGPPGTGKTLLARALANEGARCAQRPITFFMRKGADILSKWVGESERQLSLLFEEARRQQPSIIFFDEIDGLAPTRHTKTEQTQAALVATLLALLDGLEDRGQVVVIGATNRPDTIDPALRRPGRFDQELVFSPPDMAARRHILRILTQDTLLPPSHPQQHEILEEIVEHTEGCTGADLKALCTEASLNRLRSALPHLYTSSVRLSLPTINMAQLQLRREDFFAAIQRIKPSLQRGMAIGATRTPDHVEHLFHGMVFNQVLPCLMSHWPTAARAVMREQRDCADLTKAVHELAAFPVPHCGRPLVMWLSALMPHASNNEYYYSNASSGNVETNECATNGDYVHKLAKLHLATSTLVESSCTSMLLNRLPTLRTLHVHLPHIRVDFVEVAMCTEVANNAGCGGSENYLSNQSMSCNNNGMVSFNHLFGVIQAIERSAPCVVIFHGAEEWLREQQEEQNTDNVSLSECEEVEEKEEEAMNKVENTQNEQENNLMKTTHTKDNVQASHLTSNTIENVVNTVEMERVRAFRYYMNMLHATEVLLLFQSTPEHVLHTLLGVPLTHPQITNIINIDKNDVSTSSVKSSSSCSSSFCVNELTESALHPSISIIHVHLPLTPQIQDIRHFANYLSRTISLALTVRITALHTDALCGSCHTPDTSTSATGHASLQLTQAERERARERRQHAKSMALALWRKVEYRRLQLRHVLIKWVGQYISSGRYKLLVSPDLDLHPGHPLYKSWLRHTQNSRIGLQDILAKLEDESYVCLSQYHNDIDKLVANVRSFFRSRAPCDQRYRLKALELKETVVLSMYKINRSVIRFCEEHQDVQEPRHSSISSSSSCSSSSDSEELEEENEKCNGHHHHNKAYKGGGSSTKKENNEKHAMKNETMRVTMPRKTRHYYSERKRRRRGRKGQTGQGKVKQNNSGSKKNRGLPEAIKTHLSEAITSHNINATVSTRRSKSQSSRHGSRQASKSPHRASLQNSCDKRRSKSSSSNRSKSTTQHQNAVSTHRQPLRSPSSPPLYLEEWMTLQLTGLTFYQLHGVFEFVMTELEREIRALDDARSPISLSQSIVLQVLQMRGSMILSSPTSQTKNTRRSHSPMKTFPSLPYPLLRINIDNNNINDNKTSRSRSRSTSLQRQNTSRGSSPTRGDNKKKTSSSSSPTRTGVNATQRRSPSSCRAAAMAVVKALTENNVIECTSDVMNTSNTNNNILNSPLPQMQPTPQLPMNASLSLFPNVEVNNNTEKKTNQSQTARTSKSRSRSPHRSPHSLTQPPRATSNQRARSSPNKNENNGNTDRQQENEYKAQEDALCCVHEFTTRTILRAVVHVRTVHEHEEH